MSQVLYLDPVGGIAGDMFLAAALDLGVPLESLREALAGLALSEWRIEAKKVERHAISATHVDVVTAQAGHAHRPLSEIRRLLDACPTLSAGAKTLAQRIFTVLGEAEARVHNVPIEEVELHEVGAIDSIVDVCGAAVVLELLGNPRVFSAPPPLGSGTVRGAHGVLPIPAPATLEILRGAPVRFEGVGELTTPTGAAILRAVAEIGPPPELTVEKVGYGAGTRDSADCPNVLRAVLGQASHSFDAGTYVIEANLDDVTPQLLGALIEQLLGLGALDAYVLPATMKKGRPGHLLGVLAPAELRDRLVDLLFRESTTLGVRFHRVERVALGRRMVEVRTRYGDVRIKLGLKGAEVVNAFPEFDDCRKLASEKGVAVKDVWVEALSMAQALR